MDFAAEFIVVPTIYFNAVPLAAERDASVSECIIAESPILIAATSERENDNKDYCNGYDCGSGCSKSSISSHLIIPPIDFLKILCYNNYI